MTRRRRGRTRTPRARRVGIKQATVSNFENNPDKTTLTTLFKILQSLEQELVIQSKSTQSGKELEW
ncbi:MAG: helix-turn-helix domain-containing protein [Kalamiella piersonii]|uniref:helix-turn-helix domain-containing protein n=1 Tax=Pantoea piersonii TaxID=2364647 RepID=UPI00242C0CAB|nr:helix-turn-helix domain-containing protein [Pantoea piersonii]MBZ6408416.1 helix-turn-helix domain-containing protein [Pantoea piersonii]